MGGIMRSFLSSVAIASTCLFAVQASAKFSEPGIMALSRVEQCAQVLNQYLVLRRNPADANKSGAIADIERQVRAVCKGMQVKLEHHNGRTVGTVVEGR